MKTLRDVKVGEKATIVRLHGEGDEASVEFVSMPETDGREDSGIQ